jgi:enoyl-CoA hydratase/carnithine racemase
MMVATGQNSSPMENARAFLTHEVSMVFETLKVNKESGVLLVDVAAPPMNLLGPALVRDLVSLIQQAEADDTVKVLVFRSADPDYFIAHVDVIQIKEYRAEAAKLTGEASIGLMFRHLSASRLVTIAQIEGRVRAGGSEFVLACDMRFAAQESAIFSQPEAATGVSPGCGRYSTPDASHGPRSRARGHVERGGLRCGSRRTIRVDQSGAAGKCAQ